MELVISTNVETLEQAQQVIKAVIETGALSNYAITVWEQIGSEQPLIDPISFNRTEH